MAANKEMDKQIKEYLNNGILQSNKKELLIPAATMDFKIIILNKKSHTQMNTQCVMPLT